MERKKFNIHAFKKGHGILVTKCVVKSRIKSLVLSRVVCGKKARGVICSCSYGSPLFDPLTEDVAETLSSAKFQVQNPKGQNSQPPVQDLNSENPNGAPQECTFQDACHFGVTTQVSSPFLRSRRVKNKVEQHQSHGLTLKIFSSRYAIRKDLPDCSMS